MSKDDLMKKWSPIIDSMGVTGSKADWLSQYAQMISNNESKIEENTLALEDSNTEFSSLLPIAMKVASKTIGLDLVSVQPLANPGGMSQEEIDRINNEIKKENRDGKIDSIIEGKDFKEMNPEEHPDWKPGPVGSLMYMDFKYGSQNEKDEEDESPIKGRRGPRKIDLTVFKSPGISIIEHDITIVKSSGNYKINKIEKILNRIMSV